MGEAPKRLTRRREFLFVAKGLKAARTGLVVQARARGDQGPPRVGFTATKKVGGAVVRNRAKRRMRALARQLLPDLGSAGADYVFIARASTAQRDWSALLDDGKSALVRLASGLAGAAPANGKSAPSAAPTNTASGET